MGYFRAIRHHLFILISLLGCLAPWVTPREFPGAKQAEAELGRPAFSGLKIRPIAVASFNESQAVQEGRLSLYDRGRDRGDNPSEQAGTSARECSDR